MDEHYVAIGRIKRAVGLKGEVLIRVYSSVENLIIPRCLFLKTKKGFRRIKISRYRLKGNRDIVCLLEGFNNRTQAEAIEKHEVFQDKSLLPRNGQDEYFWYELEGLMVLDKEGNGLGSIFGVIEAGGQDVLVIRDENSEFLVPMVEEFVKEINTKKGFCIVELPEGLVESTSTPIKRKKK